MRDRSGLSPEADGDLGYIIDGEHSGLTEIVCLACGHLSSHTLLTCAKCGTRLMIPWGEISEGYLSAVDLLRTGQLNAGQVRQLLEGLRDVQSFYMSGSKYSVFG